LQNLSEMEIITTMGDVDTIDLLGIKRENI
jgi:hypothetical protein